MIKTLNKNRINLSSQHSNTLNLHKAYIFNKNINFLACSPIKSPINEKNYLNIDINTTPISILNKNNDKDYVISFAKYEYLDMFKNHLDHPYTISKTKISDISYFLEKMDCNLLIINDINCDPLTKMVKYTTFNIDIDKLMDPDNNYIQVSIHKLIFDNN